MDILKLYLIESGAVSLIMKFAPLYLVNFFSLFFLFQFNLFGQKQERPLKFYEVIKDDSVKMFCTVGGNVTELECADFIRYTRVDSAGDFLGYFKDVDHEGNIFCTGFYLHGKRNGYFETFYPFGSSIYSRGSYVNNIPAGPWEYFYEDGLPERTLLITETDTLLIKFVDREGNVKVVDGIGEFAGPVTGHAGTTYNNFFAIGRVQNGKPEGKWVAKYQKMTYCEETFDRGKLVTGIFPYAQLGANKEYHNKSFLKTFFLNDYLFNLEGFIPDPCEGYAPFPGIFFIEFDPKYFTSHLRKRIDSIVARDLAAGNADLYPVGDNLLTVRFNVNSLGYADNFKLVTLWGGQFLKVISANISGRTKFRIENKTLYFHLSMHVEEDHKFKYDFKFSKARY